MLSFVLYFVIAAGYVCRKILDLLSTFY